MSSFEGISGYHYAFGESYRRTVAADVYERGSHSGRPAYAPVVLLSASTAS